MCITLTERAAERFLPMCWISAPILLGAGGGSVTGTDEVFLDVLFESRRVGYNL